MKPKKASESFTTNIELVMPNDTNNLGNLFGGKLLQWLDITAAIAAQRHSGRVVVTSTINNVSFNQPIKQGSLVSMEAKISRAFTTSMEVYIDVHVEDSIKGTREKCNEAIFTFVAVDQNGTPLPVPELIPETEEEKKRYDGALRRKQLALIIAGKMQPNDATELKALFA